MPWPLASDFQTILQDPKIAFRDPYLRSCAIERDVRGQPRAWAGSFAVVYKGIDPAGNPLAIRTFSTESPQRRGRYEQIGEFLAKRRLDCLVSFEYREEEIRSLRDGKRYPVVLMDWVEGETLFYWLRNQCRNGNIAAIAGAARQWPAVVAELSRQQVAHGDLQHANIMVTPRDEFKLVDYDGMCVPALIGADSLEVGTPPYQHPHRSAALRLSPRLDDFSALLIYVVLQALAANPTLWEKYVERTNNDKLLFREDDFRSPQSSALCRDLRSSSASHVRDAAGCLFAAAAGGIEQVPLLDEIVDRQQVAPCAAGDGQIPQAIVSPRTPPAEKADDARPLRDSNQATPIARTASLPTLPGYEILAELGRSDLSTVFLARSAATGQPFAVKIAPIKTSVTEGVRRRFLMEIGRATQVRHPHIAALVASGTTGHAFYFVSEYCDGGNIAQWMDRNGGKLGPAEVRAVAQQCLDALKHAHLHRLIHGNISPQNVLLVQTGGNPLAKISDFALAQQFKSKFSGPPRRPVDPHTAGFMPRELITSQHGPTSRSDLWSLAAVLYYALSGSYPWDFQGRDPFDVILGEAPLPLRQREDTVPISLAEVVDRALRPNPAHRYASAAEMKTAWDAACKTAF